MASHEPRNAARTVGLTLATLSALAPVACGTGDHGFWTAGEAQADASSEAASSGSSAGSSSGTSGGPTSGSSSGTSSTGSSSSGASSSGAGGSSSGSASGGTGTSSDAGADEGAPGSGAEAGTDGGPTLGRGIDPPMGWSSWSFIRTQPTETAIRAQAQALHDSGLASHGYLYVNIDDYYILDPTTNVDMYGRWGVDPQAFPSGMAAMGAFVHGLGLEFGMYLTPGIPVAAVNENTPIEGTSYHAADIADTTKMENQYSHGGSMYYIDFSKPGSQEFIDSWANLLASYGADYVKLDGVGSFDIPDVQAWSQALKSAGRTIHFELSNSLDFNYASTWAMLSNGWRIDGDIECYCSSSSYPLTSWSNVSARFNDAPPWQPFSAPGARNDLDSLELGNGDNDGLTIDERKTQMSLWALAAAPLLLGTDLTNLDSGDLALMTNDEVIGVDQAGSAAKQLQGGNAQVWAAHEPDGSYAVGLFNLGGSTASVTVNWTDLGISGSKNVRDLWAQMDLGTFSGSYGASVNSHGVVLVRVGP